MSNFLSQVHSSSFQYSAPPTPEEGARTEVDQENADLVIIPTVVQSRPLILSNQPNFDTTIAQQLFNKALTSYLQDIGELNHEPESAFTEKTFMFLDPFIRYMSEFSRRGFFKHIKSLFDVLQDGVHSAMQRWLIQSLINKGLFWPKAANHLGLRPPTQNIDELGKTPSYYVSENIDRDDLTLKLLDIRKEYEQKCELALIDMARSCSNSHRQSFLYQYKQRFNISNDNGKYIFDMQLEWITALDADGIAKETHQARINQQLNKFKEAFDNIVDMLILFAVKHVTHELRALFRLRFHEDPETHVLFFSLDPFDTMVKVHRNDIPPPTIHAPVKPPVAPPLAHTTTVTFDNTTTNANTPETAVKQLCQYDAATCMDSHCTNRHKQPRTPTTNAQQQPPPTKLLCPHDAYPGCYDATCGLVHVDTPNLTCKHHPSCRNHARNACKLWNTSK